MPVTTERRNRTRTRPPGLVYAELGPSNGGLMRDLCEEGFAMRAMMPLRIGDITPFNLQLDAITRLEGQCQVVWVKEEGRLLGLCFIDNTSKIRGQIRTWLALPEEVQPPENSATPDEPHQPSTMDELREEMRSVGSREQTPRGEEPKRDESKRDEFKREASDPHLPKRERSRVEESKREELRREELPSEVSLRGESPVEELKTTSPPLLSPLEVSSASVEAASSESVSNLLESPLPFFPPLEPAIHLPPLQAEPIPSEHAAPSQHNDILGLSTLAQEAEPSPHFQTFAPSLEPLSILEKRNSPRPASPSWLDNFTLSAAIGIMLCIALLIGGFVFHQELGQLLIWLGQQMSGTETAQPPPPANSQIPVPATSAPSPDNSSSRTSHPDSSNTVSPAANSTPAKGTDDTPLAENLPKQNSAAQALAAPQKQSQITPALTPMTQTNKPGQAAANSASSASASPVDAAAEPGQQELQAARSILRSESREAEVPDAVRLLWAAVEKGSTGAEVSLAELYRTGRGVSKNCDQTRILLTAAANRGNPEAKRQLANFMAEGCR
jgi:PilZ domain